MTLRSPGSSPPHGRSQIDQCVGLVTTVSKDILTDRQKTKSHGRASFLSLLAALRSCALRFGAARRGKSCVTGDTGGSQAHHTSSHTTRVQADGSLRGTPRAGLSMILVPGTDGEESASENGSARFVCAHLVQEQIEVDELHHAACQREREAAGRWRWSSTDGGRTPPRGPTQQLHQQLHQKTSIYSSSLISHD